MKHMSREFYQYVQKTLAKKHADEVELLKEIDKQNGVNSVTDSNWAKHKEHAKALDMLHELEELYAEYKE